MNLPLNPYCFTIVFVAEHIKVILVFQTVAIPALKRNKIIVGISLTFDPIEARNFYEANLQVLCCLLIFSNRTIYRVVSTYNTIPKVGISFTQ